jgi:acyl-CoA reductase-like NAD-dependent aldehyde dehydrogenase
MPAQIYVAGEFLSSSTHQSVRAPWDDALLDDVCLADDAQLERAIDSAHRAVRPLRQSATHQRRQWLNAIADGLASQREDFATLIAREAAKPIALARAEVTRAETTFRLASEECARLGGEALALDATPALDGAVGAWTRVSSGALLAITPFNFPLNLVAHKLAPAFALAMPVVLKPAPQTPLTALMLARLVQQSGAPEALLSVVPTTVERAAKMVEDPRFSALSFTGSATVGWTLKSLAGKKRVLLELGGNAAAILAPDTDPLRWISKLVSGGYAYAGQVCIKTQRVFVPRASLQRFVEGFSASAAEVRVSDPLDPTALCGPMIDQRACDRVQSWLREAVSRGATVACGAVAERNRLSPTLVLDAPEGTRLVDEEVFGPVVTVHPYDTLEDATDAIERGRYGLQCALFTDDLRAIRQVFSSLSVGALIVNESTTMRVDSMPYGGVKDSGLGREGVRFAVDELADTKLLVVR